MRKAVELESLQQLNLSPRTASHLERKFSSLYEMVLYGRQMAYNYRIYSQFVKRPNKYNLELIFALEEAEFTHPVDDLTRTLNVNKLYKAVYTDFSNDFFEDISELSVYDYEELQIITDDELKSIKSVIDKFFDEEERLFLLYRYGLTRGGLAHTFNNTKQFFNLSRARAMKIETEALRKLGTRNLLPPIFDSPGGAEDDEYIDLLINKLSSTDEDDESEFKKELLEELECMAATPFKSSKKAQEYLRKHGVDNDCD